MTKEQIHAYFDNMLENHKSRNFLNHLIRAYMPTSNITWVLSDTQAELKCAITGEKLTPMHEVIDNFEPKDLKDSFVKTLKNLFEDSSVQFEKYVGDKKVAFTGKDTTTHLSFDVAKELIDWVITKSLSGDKHINWLLGKIKHTSFVNIAKKSNNEKIALKAQKIEDKNDNRAKFKLGDANVALAALKAKLEDSEK